MKRLVQNFSICLAVSLLAATVSCSALAAVISRDWKTPGDGLLTYDDVNRREWLDLSQTILSSQFPGVGTSQLETRELRYQYVVSQTVPTGMFAGFEVAKSPDILALADSAGIVTTTAEKAVNETSTSAIIQLLGMTNLLLDRTRIAEGLLDEFNQQINESPLRSSSVFYINGSTDHAGLRILYSQSMTPPGVMLYRVVPEPGTLLLALFCIAVRGGVR